jgi:pyruvate dehydrogenase E2 component (dihydrolipoamide acetyltransferase)
MAQFLMPKLSDTMEEGTILRWLHAEGEEVARGEPLVEIETDKADMMVDAPESGRLAILAQEGEVLPIGAPIAAIGEDAGEDAPASDAPAPSEAAAPAAAPAEEEDERTEIPVGSDGTPATIGMELSPTEVYPGAGEEEGEEDEAPEPAPEPAPAPARPAAGDGGEPGAADVRASPLARRRARELGVDLARVRGTGPGGRVVRADVDAAAEGRQDAAGAAPPARSPEPAAAPAPAAAAGAEAERPPAPPAGARAPLSRLQRTVARRMAESWAQAPHFALQRDVDATEAVALRRRLVEAAPEDQRPSLNDLVVRAVAMAVAERPERLSRFDGDALVAPSGVHVGVAVAVERGLLVPVVRDAAELRIGQIAAETRRLAARCRDGSITAPELEGSVVTISNLGMFGIDRFTGVINPPEAALLAVGRAHPAAVVRDGEVVVRDQMTLTLSVDHRALYGAEAAQFLGRIAELLEGPHALVL